MRRCSAQGTRCPSSEAQASTSITPSTRARRARARLASLRRDARALPQDRTQRPISRSPCSRRRSSSRLRCGVVIRRWQTSRSSGFRSGRPRPEPTGLRGSSVGMRALLAADDEAESHYRASLDRLALCTAAVDRARMQVLYGEWLRRSRRRREAPRTSPRGARIVRADRGPRLCRARP